MPTLSSILGKVAAAILTREFRLICKLQLHLGSTSKYTVYTAEVVALLLGVHLLHMEVSYYQSAVFAIDNQALPPILSSTSSNVKLRIFEA
jgi:hypothetical protein